MEITAPIPAKLCTVTETNNYSLWVIQARVQQIQDGGRPPFWKQFNRNILSRCSLADRRVIWLDNIGTINITPT